MESHLLQMRGLKLVLLLVILLLNFVASFTDAWIETIFISERKIIRQSHLLQMRGLKPRSKPIIRICNGRIFYRCVD